MLKKHFLLFLILFSLKLLDPLNAQNPSIGAILSPEDLFSDNEIYNGYRTLYLSIKNTGDEVLTNINVIDNNGYFSNYISCENNNIPFSCSDLSIETLNPNDVITLSFLIYNTSNCYENIQFEVTANSVSNGTINDFSDGYSYDYNNYTFVELNFNDISFQISDTYLDLNNNGLVDVGDAIEYDISSSIYTLGILYPNNQYTLNPTNLYNNETVTVSSTNNIIGDYVTATYYLNASDIAIGYAYYNPDIIYNFYDSCTYLNIYQSGNCFNCPNRFIT